MEFLSYIQFDKVLADPLFWNRKLIDSVIVAQTDIIKYICGTIGNSSPFSELTVGINDFVGSYFFKELCLSIAVCERDNGGSTEIFQKSSCLKGCFKVLSDGYDSYIIIFRSERADKLFIC